jgi:hypothetical protein
MLSLAAAAPAAAETPPAGPLEAYGSLTSVAPRRSDCAASRNPDELVVCGRRQDNLRYRLPPAAPAPGTDAHRSVSAERLALTGHRSEGGSGSCSPVGPNGLMGCAFIQWRMAEAQSAGRTPGLVERALSYLDPDE